MYFVQFVVSQVLNTDKNTAFIVLCCKPWPLALKYCIHSSELDISEPKKLCYLHLSKELYTHEVA